MISGENETYFVQFSNVIIRMTDSSPGKCCCRLFMHLCTNSEAPSSPSHITTHTGIFPSKSSSHGKGSISPFFSSSLLKKEIYSRIFNSIRCFISIFFLSFFFKSSISASLTFSSVIFSGCIQSHTRNNLSDKNPITRFWYSSYEVISILFSTSNKIEKSHSQYRSKIYFFVIHIFPGFIKIPCIQKSNACVYCG